MGERMREREVMEKGHLVILFCNPQTGCLLLLLLVLCVLFNV